VAARVVTFQDITGLSATGNGPQVGDPQDGNPQGGDPQGGNAQGRNPEGRDMFPQRVLDLFKNQEINNGDTVRGVLRGVTEFVDGICHVCELPGDFPSLDGSTLYCRCEQYFKNGVCPGSLIVRQERNLLTGLSLSGMFTQLHVSRSAGGEGRSNTSRRVRRRRRLPTYNPRTRSRIEDQRFHCHFGIEDIDIIPEF